MKFFFYEYGSSRYFYQVLWQFFNSELRFIFSDRFFRFLATTPSLLALSLSKGSRGEMDSNCFKNTEPVRKLQVFGCRLARPACRRGKVGDQIIRNFGRKIE